MKYNRSEIMKAAWAMFREMRDVTTRRWPEVERKAKLTNYFSTALIIAWSQEKARVRDANIGKQELEERLFVLNMKDHWNESDYAYERELKRKISEMAA